VRITASAPTRIDLAGGTIDIWPLYLFHPGAQTLNAAISLRAHAHIDPRDDDCVALVSIDTARDVVLAPGDRLRTDTTLPLLGRLAHHFGARGITLTTRGESPAGAGIAGSSALNIAVCGALAAWRGEAPDPAGLLQVAMNVEAQAIDVPTGAQDYRPALHGGVSAVELRVDGVHRVPLAVDPSALEARLVLAYTGASRNSGINNWDIFKRHIDGDRVVFDAFERIRDIAETMRLALEQHDWPGVGRALDAEWETRKQLAPGVTTPIIDDLIGRARAAGALAAKVCGAGGGGCLVCYVEPGGTAGVRAALAAGGARVLDFGIDGEGLRVDTLVPHHG
jgi:D-glycero-alpha-D-manno-heptose-7-phosphate kinase